MINWDSDRFQPPKALLEKCQEILLPDAAIENHGVRPVDVKRWCNKNLKTFVWMNEQDVTDFSYHYDYIYAFYIIDQKDINWFRLKWC